MNPLGGPGGLGQNNFIGQRPPMEGQLPVAGEQVFLGGQVTNDPTAALRQMAQIQDAGGLTQLLQQTLNGPSSVERHGGLLTLTGELITGQEEQAAAGGINQHSPNQPLLME